MTVNRLSTGSDATWCRAWVIDTTAEVAAFLATFNTPLGPRRGDMILDNEVGQLFIVTNGGSATQLTGLAVLPIDLTIDVDGILPVASGGTGISSLTASRIPFGAGSSPFASDADLTFDGTELNVNALIDISGAAGGQIQFPGTQNPSSDANTLDDYEEGTWTPTLIGSTGGSAVTYTAQHGYYTKIGSDVTIYFRVAISNAGALTGGIQIGNLPFTIVNVTNFRAIATMNWANMTTAFVNVFAQGIENVATINVLANTAAVVTIGAMVPADLSNTTVLAGSLSYRAAA